MKKRKISVAAFSMFLRSFHAQILKSFKRLAMDDKEIEWEITCYFSHGPNRNTVRNQICDVLNSNFDYVLSIGAAYTKLLFEEMNKLGIKKPVVFVGAGYPLDLGVIKSVEKPLTNFTGVEASPAPQLLPLHIVKECFPKTKSILFPYSITGQAGNLKKLAPKIVTEAKKLGITVEPISLDSCEAIRNIDKNKFNKSDILLFVEGCITGEEMPYLKRVCKENETIICASGLYCALQGASLSYGIEIKEMGLTAFKQMRLMATTQIPPAELPVAIIPDSASIMINRAMISEQGGTVSQNLQTSIDIGYISVDGKTLPLNEVKADTANKFVHRQQVR